MKTTVEKLRKYLKSCNLTSGRLVVYLNKLSVEIYWPRLVRSNTDLGVFMPTQINLKIADKHNRWMLKWSVVCKVLGFGVGLCWDHCDNPNKYVEGDYDDCKTE